MSDRFRKCELRFCAVALCAALLMAVTAPAYEAVLAARRTAEAAVEEIREPQIAARAAGYAVNAASGGVSGIQTTGGRTVVAGKYASSAVLRHLSVMSISGGDLPADAPGDDAPVPVEGQPDASEMADAGETVPAAEEADVSDDALITADPEVVGYTMIRLGAEAPADGSPQAPADGAPADGNAPAAPADGAPPADGNAPAAPADGAPPADGNAPAPTNAAPAERTFTPEEEAKIAAFYSNTVLAGDSVLLGFRNYCRTADPLMQKLQFLAAGSYSLHNAFWEISGKSVHPLYQGAQHKLWDSVRMIGPNRIFLFFGINDMALGVDESITLYEELIARVKEAAPQASIYLISATYVLEGTGKKGLNNTNLARFNQTMAQKAAANGWGYVDMATPTSDGRGNLLPACCSDGHLHQSKSAYVIWERVLKEFALREINAGR